MFISRIYSGTIGHSPTEVQSLMLYYNDQARVSVDLGRTFMKLMDPQERNEMNCAEPPVT
jgi:hypothetical protein